MIMTQPINDPAKNIPFIPVYKDKMDKKRQLGTSFHFNI